MINITPKQLDIVKYILRFHVPDREVYAFGSRVTGKNKPFSDLDLSIMGDEPLTFSIMGSLREAFSASDLPFRVDIVDWARTKDEFREVIKKTWEKIV